ncbi:RcnB family protein [Parasphingopyxis algicola]|uniref:RcnB family protein n=1 Tax=Parasphingopyxis algicola TaxID=2026624 RepID=UPI001FED22C9|nr:RcnB family protein [Parasphingopyxis algicola]QLC26198.1 RcnB family protein [Parasphingopyxis algicola]
MSMTMMPATAQAQSDSGASSAGIAVATQAMRGGGRHFVRHGGGRHFVHRGGGRHFVHRGGRHFFRHGHRRFHSGSRFFVGGFLPSYFLAPRYYVVNYPTYGLARPAYGYRWVRYHDDAYLVDGRGHIADGRYGVPYDRYYRDGRRYDDRYYDERRYYDDRRRGDAGDAAAGAIVGGIVGGIAGNRIAGRGNRTEGTIIGGALGAIAGGAIGSAAGRSDRYDDRYRRDDRRADRRYYDDRAPVPEYVGRGDYYPPAAPGYGVDYDYDYQDDDRVVSPPVHHAPPVQTHVAVSGPGTYAVNHANGVSQSATTTIVLNSAPATTTTFIEEEVEYVAPRRSTRRSAHRSRSCNCR